MADTTNQDESLRARVLAELRGVEDPELHRDIVSLNMVQDLAACAGVVSMRLVLTTPACPLRDTIEQDVRRVLAELPDVREVKIDWGADVRATARANGPQPVQGVRNIIAIASNKGGVGKSTVAANLAAALAGMGAQTGLLDADITGPNIPTMYGIPAGVLARRNEGLHAIEKYGVAVASIGFLLPKGTPVVWRGPMIGSGVRQLLHDLQWGELDYLVVDLPPGTSDASMSMAQEAPIAGVVVVSTPQEVSIEDATKAVTMFEKLSVPVFGIVENMSYYECPCCGTRAEIFGHGGARQAAEELGVDFLGEIPLEPSIRAGGDEGVPVVVGAPESPQAQAFMELAQKVAAKISVLQRIGVD